MESTSKRFLWIIIALAIAALVIVVLVMSNIEDRRTSLTIVSWGGAYTTSQQRAYHDPWMAMNPDVQIVNDDGSANALAGLRAQSQAGNVTWDLVDMLPSDAQLACDEGIIMPINHDAMLAPAPDGTPASRDFFAGSLGECFIPQIVYSTVLTTTSQWTGGNSPSTIKDLFDLENFPGRRALQDRPGTNLEWALYADGVHPDDVYDVLSTPRGVDRAFAKLDTIKDQIIFWTEGAQAPQLLADGEVVFATGYNGRMFEAIEVEGQSFEIIYDGQIVEWDGWVVPHGPNVDAVMDYLFFATDTQRLADQARYIPYGPARASSAPLVGNHADLGIDMNQHMPTAPSNYFAPINLDNDFWADYGDELRERFASWMLQ